MRRRKSPCAQLPFARPCSPPRSNNLRKPNLASSPHPLFRFLLFFLLPVNRKELSFTKLTCRGAAALETAEAEAQLLERPRRGLPTADSSANSRAGVCFLFITFCDSMVCFFFCELMRSKSRIVSVGVGGRRRVESGRFVARRGRGGFSCTACFCFQGCLSHKALKSFLPLSKLSFRSLRNPHASLTLLL